MAKLSKNEKELFLELQKLVRRFKGKSSGLRRSLVYIEAIYSKKEGKVIEKILEDYFEAMDRFQEMTKLDYSGPTTGFPSKDGGIC